MPKASTIFLSPARVFAVVLAAALAARIVGLLLSPLDLHFDEAQYWLWSRELDWGYFSKPPLIAWIIAATTAAFGNAEWAVRIAAPIAHAFGAWVLFALARRIYGDEAGLWAGALWLTLPGIWLSSFIMSTDALVLPAWAAALYCFQRLMERPSRTWAVLLGLALGFGALAKYAMLYFPLCAALAAWWAPAARRALLSRQGATAAVVGLLVLAPNLVWNARNSFETVAHTAANINLEGAAFRPQELFEFLGGQAAVLGPVLFVALGWFFLRAARRRQELGENERALLAFVLPPLVIILMQSLISRANANWAATAYPAALTLLAGRLIASRAGRRTLWAALVTQIAIGAVVFAIGVSPALGDRLGFSGALKRVRGWSAAAEQIAALATAPGAGYSAILVDHRALYVELAYYWRDARRGEPLPPVRAWRLHAAPEHHAEAVDPMRPQEGARVLVISMEPRYRELLADDFRRFTPLPEETAPRAAERTLALAVGEGFAPAPRDAAFEARFEALRERAAADKRSGRTP